MPDKMVTNFIRRIFCADSEMIRIEIYGLQHPEKLKLMTLPGGCRAPTAQAEIFNAVKKV